MRKFKKLTILFLFFVAAIFYQQPGIISAPKKIEDYEIELEKLKKRMVKTTKKICLLKLDIKAKDKKIAKIKREKKQLNLQKMIDEKDKMEKKLGLLVCDKKAEDMEYKVLFRQVAHNNAIKNLEAARLRSEKP